MNLKNAFREIQSNGANLFHRAAPFLAVHAATALWHIAMPVVGAVHCINSGYSEAHAGLPLVAEGVEEVGADGFCATIVPVG